MVKCLGIHMCADINTVVNFNLADKLKRLKNLVQIWSARPLTLKGKITVINSVLLSILLYPCAVLYVPDWFINDVHCILIEFLWSGKKPKVKHSTMIADLEEGGLRCPDFKTKIAAIKFSWVQRFFDDSVHVWKHCMNIYCKGKANMLLYAAPSCDQLPKDITLFYKQIFKIWKNTYSRGLSKASEVFRQVIWYNDEIRVDNRVIWYENCYNKGIQIVADLYDNNGKLLQWNTFCEKYNVNINFFVIHVFN